MKSKNLVKRMNLVALTATSPPSHRAMKLMKIVMHKEMTWRTTQTIYFLSPMTTATPSQIVTPIILLIFDLLALPALVPPLENRSAIVCLHPPCFPSRYQL